MTTKRTEYEGGYIRLEVDVDDMRYGVTIDKLARNMIGEKVIELALYNAVRKLNGEIQELVDQNRELHERLRDCYARNQGSVRYRTNAS